MSVNSHYFHHSGANGALTRFGSGARVDFVVPLAISILSVEEFIAIHIYLSLVNMSHVQFVLMSSHPWLIMHESCLG